MAASGQARIASAGAISCSDLKKDNLFGLYVCVLDDLGPLLDFGANVIRELRRGASDRFDALILKPALDVGHLKNVFISAFSLRTISGRIPAGPTTPNHTVTS
jgi:hypothetical protein